MDSMNLTTLTPEQAVQLAHKLSPAEVQSRIAEFSPDQIVAAVAALDEKQDKTWREKLKAAIKGLQEYPKLEALGRALSYRQAQTLFEDGLVIDKSESWKLSPLFVGMSHNVFTQFLHSATHSQMEIFKQEAIAEPLQHHLTVLTHEVLNQIPVHGEMLREVEDAISQLDIKELSREELSVIMNTITHSMEYYGEALDSINKMLVLAWNTSRLDLIDKLSQAKETCQRLLHQTIGKPRTPASRPTGLYAKLEERLIAVYGNPEDPQDIEALTDDEPALEALVKFSIWYLKDYWEIGLLPSIMDPLVFDHLTELTEEVQKLKADLLQKVRENLSLLGFNIVADLKKKGIFSKKILQEYIEHHQHLLKR